MARLIAALVLFSACSSTQERSADAAAGQAQTQNGSMHGKYGAGNAEGLEVKRYDLNRDQHPDVFKYYRVEADPASSGEPREVLVRKEMDINHDGKIDIVRYYDAQQQVTEEHTDLDFDGRIDTVAFFKEGVLHHRQIDVNYDEKPDVTKFYEDGQLARIESDRDNDGRVDTWEYFVNGELDRVGIDADKDGMADTWERMDKPGGIPTEEGDEPEEATSAEEAAPDDAVEGG